MTNNKFDIAKLKTAWNGGEASLLVGLYADEFEQTEIDDVTPPNAPRKRTKMEYLDIAERAMSNGVKMEFYNFVPGDQRAAYSFVCHMPSGGKTVGNVIVELKDGMIVKETTIQAREK